METNVRLAISTRLNQIYGTATEGERFLSFPKESSYVFSPKDLGMMLREDAEAMGSAVTTSNDMSRTLNYPVRGMAYSFVDHSNDQLLWEIYGEILKCAEVAVSRNEADEADLRRANDVLYTTDEEGMIVASERYQQYLRLRDRRYQVEECLSNLKLDGTPNQAELLEAENELKNIKAELAAGNLEKEMVAMENIRERVIRTSPSLVWEELRAKYNPDINEYTTFDLLTFAPTYITPSDVLKQDWDTIRLTAQEIDQLVNEAPEQLKRLFPKPAASSGYGVSFEYRSVKLERPWFDSDIFKSRYWRYAADSHEAPLAYAGHNGSAGRFPAYITALVLVRNLTTTDNQRLLEDGYVMPMVYVCKWLPECPNPDPSAKWATEIKTAPFSLSNTGGGKVVAMANNYVIDSGKCPVGDVITITATPDSTHYLANWQVNGEVVEAGGGKLKLTMTEKGLTVVPVWAVAQKATNMTIKVVGNALLSISGGPNNLDMNAYKEISDVTTIEDNAFSKYTNLKRIEIGSSVCSIGHNAFRECKELKYVAIPASTNAIAADAFRNDDNSLSSIFDVDEDNPIYTAIEGQLVESHRTKLMHTIRCKCGATYFYRNRSIGKCPNCNQPLSTQNAETKVIQVPDELAPFKIAVNEANEKIDQFLKKKKYVDLEFLKIVTDTELPLEKVYIPYWEWDIQASGDFDIEIQKIKKVKDAEGKEQTETITSMVNQKCDTADEHIFIPASKIVASKILNASNREKQSFSASTNEIFEMYTHTSKQSRETARDNVRQKLRNSALSKASNEPTKTIKREEIEYVSESSILTALPFWVGGINFRNKYYTLLVDGYSGTATTPNGFPKNKKKILITIGICVAVVAIIVLLIVLLK